MYREAPVIYFAISASHYRVSQTISVKRRYRILIENCLRHNNYNLFIKEHFSNTQVYSYLQNSVHVHVILLISYERTFPSSLYQLLIKMVL